uniref:Uncharacterized protein n=1 Tax=Arundo donax TaxID=35708 RepID=A0A0A9F725_ARUDO
MRSNSSPIIDLPRSCIKSCMLSSIEFFVSSFVTKDVSLEYWRNDVPKSSFT